MNKRKAREYAVRVIDSVINNKSMSELMTGDLSPEQEFFLFANLGAALLATPPISMPFAIVSRDASDTAAANAATVIDDNLLFLQKKRGLVK